MLTGQQQVVRLEVKDTRPASSCLYHGKSTFNIKMGADQQLTISCAAGRIQKLTVVNSDSVQEFNVTLLVTYEHQVP